MCGGGRVCVCEGEVGVRVDVHVGVHACLCVGGRWVDGCVYVCVCR